MPSGDLSSGKVTIKRIALDVLCKRQILVFMVYCIDVISRVVVGDS